MAMPSFLSPPPLSELGIGIDDLDPESLILKGLDILFPGGAINPKGYDFEGLKYPEDIEHYFMHGHYINFFINVPVWTKKPYWDVDKYAYGGMPITTKMWADWAADSAAAVASGKTDVGFGYRMMNNDSDYGGFGSSINYIRTRRISQAISLYIPDTMSFDSRLQYEHTSVREMSKDLLNSLDKTVGGLLSKLGNSKFGQGISGLMDLAEGAGKLSGFAVNDQMLVLFRQINLREFSYDFFFTPKSPREAESVQNIIRAFRFHAHPESVLDYGLFYIAPGTFDIEFMHRGKQNSNIHQVKTCVLTGYNVDYAPMGWSTHVDGMPIQTRMTLTFKETETITKQDIERGF